MNLQNNSDILELLKVKMSELCSELGCIKQFVSTNKYSSEIYFMNNHAIQLEIDWREYELFMYAVFLDNGSIPDKSVIYKYPDGRWCRKFLEEIYKVKRPQIANSYTDEYLLECFEFYRELIENNPKVLNDFCCNGEICI